MTEDEIRERVRRMLINGSLPGRWTLTYCVVASPRVPFLMWWHAN